MIKKGRPTVYNQQTADNICQRISDGESLRKIVKDKDMPSSSTIFRWLLDEEYKAFWEQYDKARNIQADNMFEELIEIADAQEKDVMRDRLRVDTRKWYLSKVLPKKFGDKLDMTSDNKALQPVLVRFITNEEERNRDTD